MNASICKLKNIAVGLWLWHFVTEFVGGMVCICGLEDELRCIEPQFSQPRQLLVLFRVFLQGQPLPEAFS
ncbi:hypothetical protein BS78_05G153000 [Paspalum vaginatum]|nr:hypothetical protein BS78_05G153000 [Paspalum vaginatum]